MVVQRMGGIYSLASKVVIWLGGGYFSPDYKFFEEFNLLGAGNKFRPDRGVGILLLGGS
jgi:hypothetical protein